MMTSAWRVCFPFIFILSFSGCATRPHQHPADPAEPLNRSIYSFNDAVDGAVLKPVASGYKKALPFPVRQGVTNFFNNIGEVWSIVNHALQFELAYASQTAARLGINSILGMAGLFDIATHAGIEPPRADLGQTLGKWGVPSGPYVMIPIFGPSTVRDGLSGVIATYYDPVNRVVDDGTRNLLTTIRMVDIRTQLLNTSDTVDAVALDKYSFIRDLYLKRRQAMIAQQAPATAEDIDYSIDDSPKALPDHSLPKLPVPSIFLPSFILK